MNFSSFETIYNTVASLIFYIYFGINYVYFNVNLSKIVCVKDHTGYFLVEQPVSIEYYHYEKQKIGTPS